MNALKDLRKAKVYISTSKAASIVGRKEDWVRKNRHLFGNEDQEDFVHQGKNLKWELSAVLRVAADLKEEYKILKHQFGKANALPMTAPQ